jgi:DNA-directed RNA polymerase specialized sigma24 family protein
MNEQKKWEDSILEFDKNLKNNIRKHKAHRDDMDITLVDSEHSENECIPKEKILKLSNDEDWIDIIYSKKAKDLHQLVKNEKLSEAINNLTSMQKEVLFLNIIKQFTVAEIAQAKQTTDRNIRKHRQKAIENIRAILSNNKGECDIETTAKILGVLVFWPFMIGWKIANIIYPKKAA